MPTRLGVGQMLEFPLVQKDPTTVGALLNMNTVAFVGAHGAVALWTGHFSHVCIVMYQVASRNPENARLSA